MHVIDNADPAHKYDPGENCYEDDYKLHGKALSRLVFSLSPQLSIYAASSARQVLAHVRVQLTHRNIIV